MHLLTPRGVALFSCLWVLNLSLLNAQNMFRELENAPMGFSHDYISVMGNYSAGSAGINNHFLNKLYKGGLISSEEKANALKRMNTYNPIGAYGEMGVAWLWKTGGSGQYDSAQQETSQKTRVHNHGIIYRERAVLWGGFQRDAFQLVFEGNRSFVGDSAELSRTRFSNIRWQELKYKLRFDKPSRAVSFGFEIALLNGQRFSQLNIQQGNLYTNPLGTALDVRLNGTWANSDTARTNWGLTNGIGASIGFDIVAYIDNAIYLKAGISDIGLIRWNKSSYYWQKDTSFQYTGIDLADQLLDPVSNNGIPSSDQLIGNPSKQAINTSLPAVFHFDIQTIDQNFIWGWSSRSWIGNRVAMSNLFWMGYSRSRFKIRTGVSFGGYARFQVPIDMALKLGNIQLQGGIQNVFSYTNSIASTGQGAWLGLGYQFGGK